jgi:hypothetical protein
MGRRRGRREKLLGGLKEERRYWKFQQEALDRTLWRTRFGRGYGRVVRRTELMNCYIQYTQISVTLINGVSK